MYQFDTKPKVISKNLDDIIKESTFSTKRNSIQQLTKIQRHLKTQPRQKKPNQRNQRCNTTINNMCDLQQSVKKLNTSTSKHSLESKTKINFLDISKVTINCSTPGQVKKAKTNIIPTNSQTKFYHPNSHTRKQLSNKRQFNSQLDHSSSLYFNQMDAVFTELEDYLRETRQKVCLKMNFFNEERNDSQTILMSEMGELILVFKEEMERLIDKCMYEEIDVLKPKNRMQTQNVTSSSITQKPPSSVNRSKQSPVTKQITSQAQSKSKRPASRQQHIKIQQFMQRQRTINSTFVSQHCQDNQPTENDTELLSMLVLKNKVNNTRRKYQNSHNNDKLDNEKMLWTKSGRSRNDCSQGEYSFRNAHQVNNNHSLYGQSKDTTEAERKKRARNMATEKSSNKENRQKSIYEIVLEENKRLKTSFGR